MRRRSNKIVYILVATLIILVLAILGVVGVLEPVKGAFFTVGEGTISVIRWPFIKVYSFFEVMGGIGELRQENVKLECEIETLKAQNAKLTEDTGELEDLRSQFSFTKYFNAETLEARIIGGTSDEARQIVVISRGLSSGVEEKDAVLTPSGSLIGIVHKVFPTTSEVFLLTDPSSIINSKIQGVVNGMGMLRGEHGVSLVMESVDKSADVKEGQTVVTSGLNGELPNGLIVGHVSEIFGAESDLFKAVKVEPTISYKTLENIFILKGLGE